MYHLGTEQLNVCYISFCNGFYYEGCTALFWFGFEVQY